MSDNVKLRLILLNEHELRLAGKALSEWERLARDNNASDEALSASTRDMVNSVRVALFHLTKPDADKATLLLAPRGFLNGPSEMEAKPDA